VTPGSTDGTPWWREAVIYQIYVRSFADANGDGLGDLTGVRQHLDHVRDLGADAIWLNPFYPSPQADAGYDVADYRDVDARFGTLQDFDELLERAHELGLRVLVDLVPNHTSDQHPWFQAALASPPGSRERARYLFRDGRGADGDQPPNDWRSNFGGPAWTRIAEEGGVPGQWYLHLFAPEQPDLDWTNQEVRDEFESIVRFWFDRGVDGIRIDVAHGLAKDPAMPDLDTGHRARGPAKSGHPHWDLDEVHDVYRAWRRIADSYPGERAFVGEAWVATPAQLARYVRPDELHTVFNFGFLLAPWNAEAMRAAIDESIGELAAVGAPPTWVLSNHDVVRHLTRLAEGDPDRGLPRARAAVLLMLALPGGAYLYQGEELGLPEVLDLPPSARQDPTFAQTGGERPGRDGCRVPMPWSGQSPPFGFGPGGSWLPQPASWHQLTVERQHDDPRSMLALYRSALRLRRALSALGDGTMTWLNANGILAFRRDPAFACAVNLGDKPVPLPVSLRTGTVLLASGDLDGTNLPPDTAVWIRSA
jgi:alpha-glucosidase